MVQPRSAVVVENMAPHLVPLVEWLGREVPIIAGPDADLHPGRSCRPAVAPAAVRVWPGEA